MRQRRAVGAALIALGLLLAINATIGPLLLGVVRFHVSAGAEAQLIGGEVVSLFVVAPLSVVAGILWTRGNALAPVLALGPALYSLYMNVQYIVGPQYNRYPGNNEYLFPLYLALIILAWTIAIRAWRQLTASSLPPLSPAMQRTLGGVMLVPNVMFAFAWLASIAGVLTGPDSSAAWQEYEKDQTLFWLVRMMDLGFVIPTSLVIASGLLRRAVWATRLTYAFIAFQTLMVAAVAGMAIMMAARSDPSTSAVLLLTSCLLTFSLGAFGVVLLRKLAGRERLVLSS